MLSQLKYLEANEDQLRDALSRSKNALHEQMTIAQEENRKRIKAKHEEEKEQKLFQFEVKKKELDWLLEMYKGSEDEAKAREQLRDFQKDREEWIYDFEMRMNEEERELDEREEEEENRLSSELFFSIFLCLFDFQI